MYFLRPEGPKVGLRIVFREIVDPGAQDGPPSLFCEILWAVRDKKKRQTGRGDQPGTPRTLQVDHGLASPLFNNLDLVRRFQNDLRLALVPFDVAGYGRLRDAQLRDCV